MSDTLPARRGGGAGVAATITLFILFGIVAAGVWAVYHFGDGHIQIDGRGLDDLDFWEVVLGVVIGVVGAIIGVLGGLFGVIVGLGAALMALVLAAAGVAAGLFITAGVLLGPILLLAAIVMLVRRAGREKHAATE